MISFKEYITELFDKPLPYRWQSKDDSFWGGNFKIGKDTYNVIGALLDEGMWDVSFIMEGGRGHRPTDKGDSIQVFSTVIAMIKEFAAKQKPSTILISASKTDTHDASRVKLYKRLIKTNASKFGYKLTKFDDMPTTAYFELERK